MLLVDYLYVIILLYHNNSDNNIIIMFNICIAQIGIWIWSNALDNSRGNQINIAQITILQLLFTNQIKSSIGFLIRGETRSTREKNLSWQSREPTNSIHIWHQVWESNPGHIGGRQVFSPLGQPCHQLNGYLSHLCFIEFQKCFEMDKQKLMSGFDKCAERKKLRSVFLSSSCVIYLLCYLKISSYCGFNNSSIFYSSAANCSVI